MGSFCSSVKTVFVETNLYENCMLKSKNRAVLYSWVRRTVATKSALLWQLRLLHCCNEQRAVLDRWGRRTVAPNSLLYCMDTFAAMLHRTARCSGQMRLLHCCNEQRAVTEYWKYSVLAMSQKFENPSSLWYTVRVYRFFSRNNDVFHPT